MLYNVWEGIINLLWNRSAIKTEGIKISTPKQMLQRLPAALAQLKVGNKSGYLLNKTCQINYFLHKAKNIAESLW